MKEILALLKSHRSIRKYKPEPIPDDLLENILTSARQAPTSSNIQAYSIIVVKDKEKKSKLAHYCGDQPYVASCPVFLAVCPDLYRLDQMCRMRNYQINDNYIETFLLAVVDSTLVAQNILVASESSGLGVCMIGGIRNNPDDVCELLKLPDKVFPLMGICLGWPDQEPMIKPRLPGPAVIHREEYNHSGFDRLIDEYDSTIKATGLYDGPRRKVQSTDGREVSDNDYSWSEHTSRRMALTDSKALRAHLRQFLMKREFPLE
ncbi:MAG: NADPH-dependent oxidoreductase [candidate division Zixibacteria bacterium]